jgi:c(7)-type cytochrome triheme protein
MRPGFLLAGLSGLLIVAAVVALVTLGSARRAAFAEYGDVIINNYSDESGIRPVVFPHWFHRIRFRCKICHGDLGFEFKAGGNNINMLKIFDGEFCGACHNGQMAWGVENCILCHSGVPGSRTRVHNSTADRLVAPPGPAPQ